MKVAMIFHELSDLFMGLTIHCHYLLASKTQAPSLFTTVIPAGLHTEEIALEFLVKSGYMNKSFLLVEKNKEDSYQYNKIRLFAMKHRSLSQ